jgi:hypothetical protein
MKTNHNISGFYLVYTTIACLLNIAPLEAGPWMYPKGNFEALLSSHEMFSKYQEASSAIWKYGNRDFVIRRVSQIPEFGGSEIEIRSITGNDDIGYQRETVQLAWSSDRGWTLKGKIIIELNREVAQKSYSIIRNHLIKARLPEELIPMGFDTPLVLWECLHKLDRGAVIQGVQYSIPTDNNDIADYQFLRKSLFDEGK